MIFKRLQKMSNVIQKKLDKIEVDSNRCCKVRANLSSCTACLDICPKDCIEIHLDQIRLNESCINCGLCTSVCPTNALKWNNPPLLQMVNSIHSQSRKEETIYITCSSKKQLVSSQPSVELPCLGMVPSEFWTYVGLISKNVQIIYDSNQCASCPLKKGEAIFKENIDSAQTYLTSSLPIDSKINEFKSQTKEEVDLSKRRLFMSLFEEVKETNTHVVKEVLEVEKSLSPFEKFDQYYQTKDGLEDMVEEVKEMKSLAIDHFLNHSINHTDKRSLLLHALKTEPELKEEYSFFIPKIEDSCNRCGACSFLCPTDAIHLDTNQSMILITDKCVSCGLCQEICYEKHISMVQAQGSLFDQKYIYLLK